MRNQYIKTLLELTKEYPNIYALISDNGAIVYDEYRACFPDHLINVGIAEATMVSSAAGMASCGKMPFIYTIASFLTMRSFEQIRNDVCNQEKNVKIIGIGAGFVYSTLGPTHHALEDIALMRILPGMTVFSPCDPREVDFLTRKAAEIDGPVYLRIATGGSPSVHQKDLEFGVPVVLREGNDVAVVSTGYMTAEALKTAEVLSARGVNAKVIHVHTIKPMSESIFLEQVSGMKLIITVEDNHSVGGFGGLISEIIASSHSHARVSRFGVENTFTHYYGNADGLKKYLGLDSETMSNRIIDLLHDQGSKT